MRFKNDINRNMSHLYLASSIPWYISSCFKNPELGRIQFLLFLTNSKLLSKSQPFSFMIKARTTLADLETPFLQWTKTLEPSSLLEKCIKLIKEIIFGE